MKQNNITMTSLSPQRYDKSKNLNRSIETMNMSTKLLSSVFDPTQSITASQSNVKIIKFQKDPLLNITKSVSTPLEIIRLLKSNLIDL